jgi:Fur family ferric uptake transcriptional regulator
VISIGREEMEGALGPLAEKHGFSPDYGHLSVFGTCASCAEAARS